MAVDTAPPATVAPTGMDRKELDRAIRRIATLTKAVDQSEWELADALAAFSPEEYERVVERLVAETGWGRGRLTTMRMTGRAWTPGVRYDDVPYVLHERYRYEPEELHRQHRTGTLGQPSPAKRRQLWTLTQMSTTITSIIDIVRDADTPEPERLRKIAAIVAYFEVHTAT